MIDENLERRKIEVEIDKITAETAILRRRLWFGAAEFVKVAGAIVVTIAGLYAAITTYRITQLETRLAVSEKQQAEKDRQAAVAAREIASNALLRANQEKASAERDLGALLGKVQSVREEIAKVTNKGSGMPAAESLQRVSGNLEAAAAASDYVLVVPAEPGQTRLGARLAEVLIRAGVRAGVNEPLKDIRNAPVVAEVRFFKEVDRQEAARILEILIQGGLKGGKVSYARRPDITRYRYFEFRPSTTLALP